MIFGAGDITPGELGTVVFAVLLLLGGVAVGVKLFVRKPPIEAEFATRKELERLRVSVEERLSEQRLEFARLMGDMHEKVNGIANNVAYLRGQWDRDRNGGA